MIPSKTLLTFFRLFNRALPKKLIHKSKIGNLFTIGEIIIIGTPDIYWKRTKNDDVFFSDHKSYKYVVKNIKLLDDGETKYTFKKIKK